MPKTTVDIRTDENGFFAHTIAFESSAPAVSISMTLMSPFATGLWMTVGIEAKDGAALKQPRALVLWHSETVQLASWALDATANIIVIHGRSKPARPNARILIQIEMQG